VIEKFEAGKMSITALSDILRVTLLAQYGGFWIDSTVFISDHFPMEFIQRDYYAQRMYDPVKWKHEACKGRWCGFLMGGIACCVTIIGIPFGLQYFKLARLALTPFGASIR
jgi:hypothetical protein